MNDLSSLTADQLAEKVEAGNRYDAKDRVRDLADAAAAELCRRLKTAETRGDTYREMVRATLIRAEAAESRLKAAEDALIVSRDRERILHGRIGRAENALERIVDYDAVKNPPFLAAQDIARAALRSPDPTT